MASSLLVVVVAWSSAAANPPEVSVRDGLLSVDATDVPLGELLQRVAEEAKFNLVLKAELDTPVSWSFSGVPVDQGVARLLGQTSSITLYGPGTDGHARVLSEVRVLRGNGDAGQGKVARQVPPLPKAIPNTALAANREQLGAARLSAVPSAIEGDRAERLGQVRAIATLRPASARRDLPRALTEDEDPMVRRVAAVGVARLRGAKAQSALVTALSDEDSIVRQRAVQGLARAGGEDAIAVLSRVLLEDSNPRVRRMAASGLGRMNTESAFWALMEAQSDGDLGVREAVTAALARLERQGLGQ